MKSWNKLLLLCLCWLSTLAFSTIVHADEFLDPEVAFKVDARMIDTSKLQVRFTIAEGYYLYRDKIKIASNDGVLGQFDLPAGKVKFDQTFNKEVETYRQQMTVTIPVTQNGDFTLQLSRQGCADQGICYPPQQSEVRIAAFAAGAVSPQTEARPITTQASELGSSDTTLSENESGKINQALQSGKLTLIVPLFLLLGLGLAFTPCVLPMLPILSYIIVGEGQHVTRLRAFLLSLSYALGMALVYTSLGIAAGLLGEGLAATLQNPWVLSAFAIMMVVMALSLFDVYQLQMPGAIQSRLTAVSEGQSKGKIAGVFVMGALSALIVGPCVAAPLAGALVYISQTRDVVVGGSALFSMAMGMSVPLLLLGLSAGSLLPRAGRWMEGVKTFFGVLMLAMAWWMVNPVLANGVQMAGWALLFLGYAGYLLMSKKSGHFAKAWALLLALLGAVQAVGLASGARDVFSPLAHLTGQAVHPAAFQRVRSLAELERAIQQNKGKIVMLDFYADWCVSCKEMEKLTFTDPKIKQQMEQMLLLQADVTANNADDKALLKRFGLFGPPGIIFFDSSGTEMQGKRVIGYQNTAKFQQSLDLVVN